MRSSIWRVALCAALAHGAGFAGAAVSAADSPAGPASAAKAADNAETPAAASRGKDRLKKLADNLWIDTENKWVILDGEVRHRSG